MEKWASFCVGDILDYENKVNIIAHQVNCQGVMGGGLALQIKSKWPDVNRAYVELVDNRDELMGICQIVRVGHKFGVANLFGQYDMGGGRQTDYEALYTALGSLRNQMVVIDLKSVAFPVKLGCGLAGGDWRIVSSLIQVAFEGSGIAITFVEYSPKNENLFK